MQKVLKRFLTFALAIAMCLGITAIARTATEYIVADAAEGTYYSKITATGGEQLLGQLHDLITSTHTKYTSYDDCKNTTTIMKTDAGTASNTVMEFYSHINMSSTWGSGASGTWNREHVWAQSLSKDSVTGNQIWGTNGGGSDLHHIRPAETDLNGERGNKLYGVALTKTPAYTRGSNVALGGYISGNTFEPLDNAKGDVARIIMYVYTHYNSYSSSIFGGYATTNGSGSSSYFGSLDLTRIVTASNEAAAKKLLLEWNASDPVDEIETARNEAVYSIQKNRNPFIDHPEYADAIWGDGSVTPTPSPTLQSIAFDASAFTLNIGQSRSLTVIPTPGNATATVNWSSSKTSVATVVNGKVTAVGEGTATITATSTTNSSIKTTAQVTVIKSSTPIPTPSDTFEAGTYKMALDITAADLTKKVYFTGELNDRNFGLTTTEVGDAADVVAAEANGGYTLKIGNEYLELEYSTTSSGGASSKIVLNDRSTGAWNFDSDLKVLTWTISTSGKSYYLGTYTSPSTNKTFETLSSSEVKYISGDNAENVGKTQFPVVFEKVGGSLEEKPDVLESITIDPSAINVKEGGTYKLNILSVPSNITAEVEWTTSNPTVATVSADGTVRAIKAGTATITATSKTDPSITATATVTVTADTTVVTPPVVDVTAFKSAVNAITDNGTLSTRRTQINAAIAEYAKLTIDAKAQVAAEYTVLTNAIKKLADDYNAAAENAELIAIGGIL